MTLPFEEGGVAFDAHDLAVRAFSSDGTPAVVTRFTNWKITRLHDGAEFTGPPILEGEAEGETLARLKTFIQAHPGCLGHR